MNAKRRKRAAAAKERARVRNRVEIEPAWLEVARAHDGLLRGHPEPVMLAAAWVSDPGGSVFVARRVWRTEPLSGRVPLKVACTTEDAVIDQVISRQEEARLVLLVIALEEDAGTGIEAVYAALQGNADLRVWSEAAHIPEPRTIAEVGRVLPKTPQFAADVHVVTGDHDLREDCHGDEWIGAGLAVTSLDRAVRTELRFHYVGQDELNDWTLGVWLTARD